MSEPNYHNGQGMFSSVIFSDETEGAVDLHECPHNRCRCGVCAVCGQQKHMAIHGPSFRQPPGSKPWGHKFKEKA